MNPTPYKDIAFESFSLASRIPQDIFKGVSAGRITGSEFNERNYYKYISSEQTSKEPVVRELIDRLLETGQLEAKDQRYGAWDRNLDYLIEWTSAYVLNEVDQTRIHLWESTADKNNTEFMTIDEIRATKGLPNLKDKEAGIMVLGVERIRAQQMRMELSPSQERPGQTQPKEGEVQGNRPEER